MPFLEKVGVVYRSFLELQCIKNEEIIMMNKVRITAIKIEDWLTTLLVMYEIDTSYIF